jgi:hypothetical protein
MKEGESIQPEVKARRKLLAGVGIGLLSLLSLFKSGLFSKKNPVISCPPPSEKKETMKVLSQDGKLVEVDVSRMKRIKEKISDEELKNWIRKG